MTLNRVICPPFGACEIDYGFMVFKSRRRKVLFPTAAAPKATFLVSPTFSSGIFGLGAWGWFDFTLPASYSAGSDLTVKITQAAVGPLTPGFDFFRVAGAQYDGGSYTNSAVTFAVPPSSWCSSIGVRRVDYCALDHAGGSLVKIDATAAQSVLSFTVPGLNQANPQGSGVSGCGGSVVGPTPPGNPPDALGYIRNSPAGYTGAQYPPQSWDDLGGFVYPPDPGTTPQVVAGTVALAPGGTVSIGVQGAVSFSSSTYFKIFKIEVVTTGAVTTNIPLSSMMKWNTLAAMPSPVRSAAVIHAFPPFGGQDWALYIQL